MSDTELQWRGLPPCSNNIADSALATLDFFPLVKTTSTWGKLVALNWFGVSALWTVASPCLYSKTGAIEAAPPQVTLRAAEAGVQSWWMALKLPPSYFSFSCCHSLSHREENPLWDSLCVKAVYPLFKIPPLIRCDAGRNDQNRVVFFFVKLRRVASKR